MHLVSVLHHRRSVAFGLSGETLYSWPRTGTRNKMGKEKQHLLRKRRAARVGTACLANRARSATAEFTTGRTHLQIEMARSVSAKVWNGCSGLQGEHLGLPRVCVVANVSNFTQALLEYASIDSWTECRAEPTASRGGRMTGCSSISASMARMAEPPVWYRLRAPRAPTPASRSPVQMLRALSTVSWPACCGLHQHAHPMPREVLFPLTPTPSNSLYAPRTTLITRAA